MHTGLVSIDLEAAGQLSGIESLRATGQNSGNLLFTYAVSTQVRNPSCLGFHFLPKLSASKSVFSSVVLAAANWIIKQPDFGFLADQLEQVSLTVCCVGLGAQISREEISCIPEGTRHFLEVLGRKSPLIGLRGISTELILQACGITNTLVCGCPSLFPHFQRPPIPKPVAITGSTRLSMSFTRFGPREYISSDAQDQMARFASRHADWIILQSESPVIEFLVAPTQDTAEWMHRYYDVPTGEVSALAAKMRFFKTQPAWIDFIRENIDVTISSRIHGCVASLLAGKPAYLVPHDYRTTELAEAMGIPMLPRSLFATAKDRRDLDSAIEPLNFADYGRKQVENLCRLKQIYTDCGVSRIDN